MPRIAFEARPKPSQIALVAFQVRKKVDAREQQHAGDVVTLVVAARRHDDTSEMRRFERGRWDTGPSQASHHDCRREIETSNVVSTCDLASAVMLHCTTLRPNRH